MNKSLFLLSFNILFLLGNQSFAANHISDKELWSHVVTVDRLTWQEREGIKKINKLADDKVLVRRLYVDITGKIPTYEQLVTYLGDKDINKRQKLIDQLLDSPGYASNFANMWGDLLRIPYNENEGGIFGNHHNDFKRYIERSVYENKTYDHLVYEMLTSEGHVIKNPEVAFYFRDFQTDTMDTTNATVKAFLGTRIGCAQCHNHRFDKWTQKEFYGLAAHLWGVDTIHSHSFDVYYILRDHLRKLNEKGWNDPITANMEYVLIPSRQSIAFNKSDRLTFPENYTYDNAKPGEMVEESIVFDYGDTEVKGKDRREKFAKWLTSKKNPMFARVMANRLWKRIMGVAIMEPVDDWKDNIEIQNPKLFEALGDIFASVDFDFKAFLSVILNSEAYQMAVDEKNELDSENYKLQGAALKRMSAPQICDSLLTLTYGNLDRFSKMGSRYFEFDDRLRKIAFDFHELIVPHTEALYQQYGREGMSHRTDEKIISEMLAYAKKVKELEAEYNIGPEGYIGRKFKGANPTLAKKGDMMKNQMMGSYKHDKEIVRANLVSDPNFMNVFGATDRSSPETVGSPDASIKQILKMINSQECHDALQKGSHLMKGLYKNEKLAEKVAYLYYSIYGRPPNKKELAIAAEYIGNSNKHEHWCNYTLALINSPEFYFVQ